MTKPQPQPSELPQLPPGLGDQIIKFLEIWLNPCLRRQYFPDEQGATDSFKKHISSQMAAGEGKFEAIQGWLESVLNQ